MTFQEQLQSYIDLIQCSAKDLAKAAELSEAALSRYRSGARTPERDSEQLVGLASGIAFLARQRNLDGLSEPDILFKLQESLSDDRPNAAPLIANFNLLVNLLEINLTELSRSMNFDASYLSRIRSGQRQPADLQTFSDKVCRYVVAHYSEPAQKEAVAHLIQADTTQLSQKEDYFHALSQWLYQNAPDSSSELLGFLKKIDEFDLDEYIRAIHFDELKVPTLPFQFSTSKDYYGLEQLREGEVDFLKSTVLSNCTEPVYMYCDLPMEDMAEDLDFSKKWMFGLAMVLKKGLDIHFIHNINRPFAEMMLGLENWIPLYMTGQVHPYYLKGVHNQVFGHLNYFSGSTAMTGESITGYHEDTRYHLTRHKKELDFYRKKTTHLMGKAAPLMDIYRSDSRSQYEAFLSLHETTKGTRHNIWSSIPVYTLSEALLEQILSHNELSEPERLMIRDYCGKQRAQFRMTLKQNEVYDELPVYTEEEFQTRPMLLHLPDLFLTRNITYRYEEYRQHLEETKHMIDEVSPSSYHISFMEQPAFRNIQIRIHEGEHVIISKSNSPAIHFVIKNPQLRHALEHFKTAVFESL
ncbi:MAG: hypothetical protein IJ567_03305 [Lachnospiraceae bacterium]|nr:hypothetical protein [Lachnospiraceae bacterium]